MVGVVAIFTWINWSEEVEAKRRHSSIEKDIERERWRAKELGRTTVMDDGFADRYMASLKK